MPTGGARRGSEGASQPGGAGDAPPPHASKIAQATALKLLALAALAVLVWIARPVGVGLLLGMLVAFTLQPLYERLRASGRSARTAALVCVFGTMTLIAGAFAAFA